MQFIINVEHTLALIGEPHYRPVVMMGIVEKIVDILSKHYAYEVDTDIPRFSYIAWNALLIQTLHTEIKPLLDILRHVGYTGQPVRVIYNSPERFIRVWR